MVTQAMLQLTSIAEDISAVLVSVSWCSYSSRTTGAFLPSGQESIPVIPTLIFDRYEPKLQQETVVVLQLMLVSRHSKAERPENVGFPSKSYVRFHVGD